MTFLPLPLPASDHRLSAYDYDLPRELIAQYPMAQRDQSRMLMMQRDTGALHHHVFSDMVDVLSPGDVVVLNNTKVLPARLLGHRRGHSGEVEVLLLHPNPQDDTVWTAMVRPAKKLKPGTVVEFLNTATTVEVLEPAERGRTTVQVLLDGDRCITNWIHKTGHMPIPPYLSRDAEDSDKTAYQTVFAKPHDTLTGAQAAPTAGLHMTDEVLARLKTKGVEVAEVTLSVGAGTFRSVEHDDISKHQMDPEAYHVSQRAADTINAAKARGNKVFSIGTTVTKTLETVAQKYDGLLKEDSDWSRLFITPGFTFQVVDGLLTNFHLPKTTLLMLVSAFSCRQHILTAYREAVAQQYRFYSYGDCMLLV